MFTAVKVDRAGEEEGDFQEKPGEYRQDASENPWPQTDESGVVRKEPGDPGAVNQPEAEPCQHQNRNRQPSAEEGADQTGGRQKGRN